MQARDFCFWMQSLFEVADIRQFDERQTALIKQHLGLVFQHDPEITGVEHGPAPISENPAIDLVRRVKHPPLFKIGDQPRGNRDTLLC